MFSHTEASCIRCGSLQTITVHDSINVREEPALKAEVLDGSAFVWECAQCGARNLVRSQTLYHDPDERLMIWLTLGSEELEERVRAAYGGMEELKGYTARFVDDAGSLIEKVKIFDAGLDDVVMELTKYVVRMELRGSMRERADELASAPFKFLRLDGADGEITFAYPLDGQMLMAAVGFNVYEDCRGILNRNPAMAAAASGFAKVDAAFVSRYFR